MKRLTLLDLFLFSFLILCVIGSAVPGWLKRREARFDALALRQLIEIRDELYEFNKESDSHEAIQVFNLLEGGRFPKPFSSIIVKPEIEVHYLVNLKRDRGQIIFLSLNHRRGALEHRWIDIYGTRRQQSIERHS